MGKEHMKSSFDTESAEFSFICMKQNTGEYFKDLDLITKLLVPKPEANYQEGSINIEVLSENYNTEDICISDDKEDETKEDSNQPNLNDGFGFALRARKDFVNICSTFDEVFGIDPCEVSLPQRHKLRLQYEQVNVTDKVREATIENGKIKVNIKTESIIEITTNDQNRDSSSKQMSEYQMINSIVQNLNRVPEITLRLFKLDKTLSMSKR
ncbi:uncharacterized protein LOC143197631 isoform X4 [Rhynchophorus ferrugineus]|uniref:uncharacterized protein LOC143197631 isoform X4 n=1 Tax=Rhynchophorus ferrugineus TaxID=354439 RepID=UPI003FCD0779